MLVGIVQTLDFLLLRELLTQQQLEPVEHLLVILCKVAQVVHQHLAQYHQVAGLVESVKVWAEFQAVQAVAVKDLLLVALVLLVTAVDIHQMKAMQVELVVRVHQNMAAAAAAVPQQLEVMVHLQQAVQVVLVRLQVLRVVQ